MRRLVLVVSVALLVGFLDGPVFAQTEGERDAELDFIALTNDARADRGKGTLTENADLTRIAREHSERMAADGELYHNESLGDEVSGWSKLGENVGCGEDAASIHAAFMASDGHRHNILDGNFTRIGVGVVQDGSTLWVTEIFMRPSQAQAPQPRQPRTTGGSGEPIAATVASPSAPTAPADPAQPPRPVRRRPEAPLRTVGMIEDLTAW
ncbi:MAG TPA: CAP domain-containing protein [Actinomycetota bacterium]